MTIPLDNLYDYIFSLTGHNNKNLIMYRFDPHGSKRLENLIMHNHRDELRFYVSNINKKSQSMHYKLLFCHDQEPLNFKLYNSPEASKSRKKLFFSMEGALNRVDNPIGKKLYQKRNISGHPLVPPTIYDKKLLLHSEKNSDDLKEYEKNGFLGVYYWSHAFIALDWYRFAKHDQTLKKIADMSFNKDFNIYCRSWTGTREYRLKFLNKISSNNITKHSNIFFNEYDDNANFFDYEVKNKNWSLSKKEKSNIKKLNYKKNQNLNPTLSAVYNSDDYKESAIDIVLETVFDQNKIHLTEKILRPIACGKPFILVSEMGSLSYLRSHGFKTFGNLIDESYDSINDPIERLNAIIHTMKKISELNKKEKYELFSEMHKIAEHNKTHFFSEEFFGSINSELKKNLHTSLKLLDDPKYQTGKEPTLAYRAYRRYKNYLFGIQKDVAARLVLEYPERIELSKKNIGKY